MAKKRMFRLDVLETDAFLEMPLTTQALYFHLNLRADDDGFVGNPKQIVRYIGASNDDLKLLIAKRFVLTFDDGVIVIKHWRMHNTLSKDRYHETKYIEDKTMLRLKDNKAYTFDRNGEVIDDSKLIEMSQRQTKDEQKTTSDLDIGIDKEKDKRYKRFTPPTLEEVQAYCKERGNKVDAKAFFDYFTTGGWKDSKGNPVKNWKQKIITWEKFEPKDKPKKENQFNQMIKTGYNFDEIERMVLNE